MEMILEKQIYFMSNLG